MVDPHNPQSKNALRKQLLEARATLPAEARSAADTALCHQLAILLATLPVQCLGIYLPIRNEPDLDAAYRTLSGRGIRLALPVVTGRDQPLAFALWQPGEPLRKDTLGTTVPVQQTLTLPDTLLIPCVGFNRQRFRLGYGGGFYDRTLDRQDRPRTVGVAYALSEASFTPQQHDVPLDMIMTEQQVF